MPHTNEWLEVGRIAKTVFHGVMTIDELKVDSEEALVFLAEGQAPVHFIIDLTNLKQFPTNLLQIKDTLVYTSHPSVGWQAFYGAPALASSLIGIFGQLARAKMRTFRSYEQSVRFIIEQDPTVTIALRGK